MLLYDIPLIKSSLSIKCLGGLFTRTKTHDPVQVKSQQWLPKTYYQLIVAKSSAFELYRYKRSYKFEKIDMEFVNSTDVYGEICNIKTCTVKISESKEYLDVVIVTLNTGELLVYHYSREDKRFICSYRDIIFKQKSQTINTQNPRNLGNYIISSQQNHFLISSIRCFKKLYQIQATQYQQKIKLQIKPHDIHVKQNHLCWNIIWLPSMGNQLEYLGKYVAIEKAVVTGDMEVGNGGREGMVDEKEEQKYLLIQKKLRYYYIQRNYKIVERQQKRQGYKNLNQTAHMLIPLSSSSFFILYQNRLRLRQLINQSSKDQPKQQLIDVEFPLRQALVDKNIKCIFSAFSRQTLEDKKNVIHLVNQFGDLFKVEYYLTSSFVASFSLKYVNSVKTVHSVVYVGEVVNNLCVLGENQPFRFKHQTATLLLLGLQRFSVSLYLLLPTQSMDTRPKQTRVNVRPTGKSKTSKNYPQYSDKISFKPILQRCRDLQICDQIQHMGVIIDAKVANLRGSTEKEEGKSHEQNFQIFALTNSGNLRHQEHIDQTLDNIESHKSHLKIIKKGLKIKQVNSLQSMKLHQIFCFKKSQKQSYHKIVILCTNGKTNSYTISNDVFTNNKQLSFEQNSTSVYIGKLQDQSYVQVVGNKIRHIKREKNGSKELPIKNKIVLAICSGRQIFVVLYGGEVMLYELDKEKDSVQPRKQFYVNDQVVSMQLTPLENNKIDQNTNKRASRFLIIGTKNYQIIIFKIIFKSDRQTSFEQVFAENVKSPIQTISSIVVINNDQSSSNGQKMYHVFLGMENGSMIKMEFDRNMKKVTQKISLIGSRPVKLKRCSIGSRRQDSLLITTDKTFVYYNHNGKYKMHLIAYSNIDIATEMRLAENPNTIMTFGERNYPHKDLVRILSIESFGEDFHDERVDLFFSGKKLLVFENNIGIIEADPSYEKMKKRRPQTDIDVQSSFIEIQNLQKTWKSQFTIYKVKDSKKIAAIYFDQTKQICICAAYNSIKTGPNAGNYLIFGCAEGISYYPKMQAKQQTIKIYSWLVEKKMNEKENEYKTQFLYSLNIDAIPLVIEPFFKGQKFLIGIGNTMRMYQIGKKKLLLKAEVRNLPSNVNQIKTIGKKIYITSVADSFHLFKYIPQEKTFYDVAQDQLPKFITAMNIVDAETVCTADKFGNLFIGRLTENAKTEFENLSGTSKILESGHLCKFNTLAKINVGQIVTSIQKVSLYTSKTEVILYSTVMGQIRVLYPLTEYQEVKVFPLLEQKIKEKYKIKPIGGNNWGASKNVLMGEYVEKFLSMNENDQREILRNTQIIDENYVDYVKDMIEGIRNKVI